jgi:hypothetical protein
MESRMSPPLRLLSCVAAFLVTGPAFGQATTRPCGLDEAPGPACLLARKDLPSVDTKSVYWHLDSFPSKAAAQDSLTANGTIVEAFDKIWLFTIAPRAWRAKHGRHVALLGPLPLDPAPRYTAEYLRSVFTPGMTAPLHVHSGPEAFYAVSGDTCLETPEGVQLGRGPGNSLMIRAGPPMLLMAIGQQPRRGFALILHDGARQPTTLTHDWHPTGLCERQLTQDRAR